MTNLHIRTVPMISEARRRKREKEIAAIDAKLGFAPPAPPPSSLEGAKSAENEKGRSAKTPSRIKISSIVWNEKRVSRYAKVEDLVPVVRRLQQESDVPLKGLCAAFLRALQYFESDHDQAVLLRFLSTKGYIPGHNDLSFTQIKLPGLYRRFTLPRAFLREAHSLLSLRPPQ